MSANTNTELQKEWNAFNRIKVKDFEIQSPFKHFLKGTPVNKIYSYFEDKYDIDIDELT